ncbi:MAG: hypothetical protein ACYDHZ_00735 [Dehalococcoidia bacterium]
MASKGAAIAIGLAAAVGIIVLATRKTAAGGSEDVVIRIYDENGNPVPVSALIGAGTANLTEGQSYTANVTITNASTKAGTPVDAVLVLAATIMAGSHNLITPWSQSPSFNAGESKSFSFPFSIPIGYGGLAGAVSITVKDPSGNSVAAGSESIAIASLPIDYNATITIT